MGQLPPDVRACRIDGVHGVLSAIVQNCSEQSTAANTIVTHQPSPHKRGLANCRLTQTACCQSRSRPSGSIVVASFPVPSRIGRKSCRRLQAARSGLDRRRWHGPAQVAQVAWAGAGGMRSSPLGSEYVNVQVPTAPPPPSTCGQPPAHRVLSRLYTPGASRATRGWEQ